MKKIFFLLFMISATGVYAQTSTSGSQSEPVQVAEQMPEFQGGTTALINYLSENLKYPKEAINSEITGTVFVKFIVEEDGSINKNVEVLRGIGYGCDEEAVRIVSNMPDWSPGVTNGKNVRVSYTLPIKYSLK